MNRKLEFDINKIPHTKNTSVYEGVTVVEYHFCEWDKSKGTGKLILVRDSLDEMKVDERDNLLVHGSYPTGDNLEFESLKASCLTAFARYWKLRLPATVQKKAVSIDWDGMGGGSTYLSQE